ncbi:MAG: alpha-amylase family glycosyl hydrolase [Ornithinimicrobium sp.]
MTHSGMGSLPYDQGVAFRVWAPHADGVAVTGDFDDWGASVHPLAHEGGGYWYGEVGEAGVGQEYQFVLTLGDDTAYRIDPYARAVTSSVGNGIIVDPHAFDWGDDAFECPPHHELVIYETHIGSFVGSEGTVGDLEGLTGKLDYLQALGINAIELMPLMEFAGDYSWGYNPAHLFAVESSYGGPEALRGFVKEAHRRGIAVIIDVVYNHFGPSDLGLWQFDGWSVNDKGGIYFYNDERSSTPWGDTRPDYGREEVRRFIRDNALMWLREFHADGLRLDMTPYMRSVDGSGWEIDEGWSLMRWIADSVREERSDAIVIAEDLHGEMAVTSTDAGGAAMHAQWDNQFVHPVRAALAADDEARSVGAVAAAVTARYHHAFDRVIYTESHDEVANGKARVPSEVMAGNADGWPSQKLATLGAALVLTTPGIPMIFQGQEFLEDEWFRDTVPLDWKRAEQFRDIVRMYRDLIALRRNLVGDTAALSGEHVDLLDVDEDRKLLAFHRRDDHGGHAVVVANFSASARAGTIAMPGGAGARWRVRFNSDAGTYSQLFGDHATPDVTVDSHGGGYVDVGAYSLVVLVPQR